MNQTTSQDEFYMQRCIELARNGHAYAAPNPMVGSVIVHDNIIIGEGYHRCYGENHAEVNAIESVKDKSLLKHATIYVTLEPCAHYGKTPPCSLRIIQEGIPNVVVGSIDTFSKVSGKGIKMMEDAGVIVRTGVLDAECRFLNRRFFTYHEKQRPYIILKWAETKDGFIDKIRENAESAAWITTEVARSLVHKWRSETMAIMVGTETALQDNPSLNIRSWVGNNPLRLVVDRNLRLTDELSLFDGNIPTIVYTNCIADDRDNVSYVTISKSDDMLVEIMQDLHKRQVNSVLIEGGAQLLNIFIEAGLWDEARVFVGNKHFGDGIKAPSLNNSYTLDSIDGSELKTMFNS